MDDSEERNNELNLAIDSMIYRFGATGKERKNNINESYRQIMSVAPPTMHRYFLWAARERAHFFAPSSSLDDNEVWFQEIRRLIEPAIGKNEHFIESKRAEITRNL